LSLKFQLHSEEVPEGIKYPEVEISGYLEGVKVYEEEVFVEDKVGSLKKYFFVLMSVATSTFYLEKLVELFSS